ncbi:MAG: hypothetical protein Q9208_000392 [Pyrenodesmia sp. 3 TL-2023]
MASSTVPRPIFRQSFKRIYNTRPFSTTQQHLAPEPQGKRLHPAYTPSPSLTEPGSYSNPTFPTPNNPRPPPVESMQGLVYSSINRRAPTPARRSALEETTAAYRAADLSAHLHRRFRPGDIYSPHDLSPVEQEKFRFKRTRPRDTPPLPSAKSKRSDAFDVLNLHPLSEYANFNMMTEFVTGMGRLKGRRETGLRGVNQRRISRAVRRSVGMGLCPSVHRHPEMLEREKVEITRKRLGAGAGGFGGGSFRPGGARRFG